ncbi:putative nitrilase, partial [Aureobasidium melanogenum]
MVKAAIGQICSTADLSHNLEQCKTLVKKAVAEGAKVLFLPEASDYIGGSPDESYNLCKSVTESPFVLGLQEEAKKNKLCINVGIHEPSETPKKIKNTLVWIDENGEITHRYQKLHMFDMELDDGPTMKESDTVEPGNSILPPFDSPVGRVGSCICFDLRFPELALALKRQKIDVLCYPSAFAPDTGKYHWHALLQARAIETQSYVLAPAQVGPHNKKRSSFGHSLIVDPWGRILAELGSQEDFKNKGDSWEPELATVDIDHDLIAKIKKGVPLHRRTSTPTPSHLYGHFNSVINIVMSVVQASTPSTREGYSSEDYTIGITCALPIELAATVRMLDKEHPRLLQDPGDDNSYRFGHIGNHNVVIGCLAAGRTGLVSAASVALKMKSSFRCVRFGLMVGIGGGVPSEEHDIRLGDVGVSKPAGQHGGVVQYDLGKTQSNGNFERTGLLSPPPEALLTTITDVIAAQEMDELNTAAHLSQLAQKLPAYGFPLKLTDDLYPPNHLHKGGKTCLDCGKEGLVPREERANKVPAIHYGTIASGNRVMKDAVERDIISKALGGVLCFEMEAAGLMNNFPCLVIRGISDYSDSHKNDGWQRYAAATAAAFAKELLNHLAPTKVAQTQTISQAMSDLSSQLAKNTGVAQQTGRRIE